MGESPYTSSSHFSASLVSVGSVGESCMVGMPAMLILLSVGVSPVILDCPYQRPEANGGQVEACECSHYSYLSLGILQWWASLMRRLLSGISPSAHLPMVAIYAGSIYRHASDQGHGSRIARVTWRIPLQRYSQHASHKTRTYRVSMPDA